MNVKSPKFLAALAALLLTVSATASSQVPGTQSPVLSLLGLMEVRAMCYEKCHEELDEDLHYCNETYSKLSPPWNECAGDALAIYYRCTEDCPPVKAPDFLQPLD